MLTARALSACVASLSFVALSSMAPLAMAQPGQQTRVEVPDEHAAMGKVYRVHPVKDAQVTFTSDAMLEHIKGISNRVSGYCVAPNSGDKLEAQLVAARFELPVASMDTGIPTRNQHMQGDRWLGATEHPSITFVVSGTEDVSLAMEKAAFKTYDATLVGEMTVKGETREMKIPARLTFMPESDGTRARAPGDLLAIRSQFSITLSEFGVAVGDQAIESGMVADELSLDIFLLLTTFDPARRAAPAGN